jgi:hypothetical protein
MPTGYATISLIVSCWRTYATVRPAKTWPLHQAGGRWATPNMLQTFDFAYVLL